jgi:NAD(P)-dependent dehydrogenase (short-subunit alcohol dehydrogenase family)
VTLSGKTCLVTGGATGIGQAVAKTLAAAGARVAIAGRREAKLREAAATWRGEPPLLVHPVDVTSRQSVAALFAWADAELGRVDILVNSAGVNTPQRMMADITPEIWDTVMQINATGVFNCIHAVLPQMRERRDGLIINISSVAGLRASALGGVAYCASKFAVTALSTAVALEEGRHNIRVTNICPGEVNTPILEHRLQPPSAEHRAQILVPEDVAAAVLMVASLPPRAHVAEMIIKPTSQDYA